MTQYGKRGIIYTQYLKILLFEVRNMSYSNNVSQLILKLQTRLDELDKENLTFSEILKVSKEIDSLIAQ